MYTLKTQEVWGADKKTIQTGTHKETTCGSQNPVTGIGAASGIAGLKHAASTSFSPRPASSPQRREGFCALLGSFASQFLYAEIFTIGHV